MSRNKQLTKSASRVRNQGEVFTPINFAMHIFQRWMKVSCRQPEDVFVDLQCGTGNLLKAVLLWKIENNLSKEDAFRTILGVDLLHDNVEDCRRQLLSTAGVEDVELFRLLVTQNIIQGDSVKNTVDELFCANMLPEK